VPSVETEEHPEAGEEGSRRSPIVVVVVALLLVAVAAIAWWSQRERLVSVPDVVGQNVDGETLEPVRTLLQSRELVIGEISDGECGVLFVPDTVVVSQAPAAGEEVPFGTQVDLVLCRDRGPSRSPLGQVPDSTRSCGGGVRLGTPGSRMRLGWRQHRGTPASL
jgi:hypothetical protein